MTDAGTGKIAWNVEYRFVPYNGATLVPIINFAKTAVTVKVPPLAGKKVTDLLSGEAVDGGKPLTLGADDARMIASRVE